MASPNDSKELVLITGGSGFLALYCTLAALAANYQVRATVRSLKREKEVREMLTAGGATDLSELTFVEADLSSDHGWKEAAEGCTHVLHIASPLPGARPKHEDDLILPARDGTLRVLRAARDSGVQRVVITSSMGAIAYGHRDWDYTKAFVETDWTDVDGPGVSAYMKSKTLAERAAWNFVEKEGRGLELVTLQPGLILAPVLGRDSSTSIEVVQRMLTGAMPLAPRMSFPVIDARDLADLHITAMRHPSAKGERFICCTELLTLKEMGLVLHQEMGKRAKKAPVRELPNFILRIVALFDPGISVVLSELDKPKIGSSEKAKRLLGWEPRSREATLVDTAESLYKFNLV